MVVVGGTVVVDVVVEVVEVVVGAAVVVVVGVKMTPKPVQLEAGMQRLLTTWPVLGWT